jgi:hypothetical protein
VSPTDRRARESYALSLITPRLILTAAALLPLLWALICATLAISGEN